MTLKIFNSICLYNKTMVKCIQKIIKIFKQWYFEPNIQCIMQWYPDNKMYWLWERCYGDWSLNQVMGSSPVEALNFSGSQANFLHCKLFLTMMIKAINFLLHGSRINDSFHMKFPLTFISFSLLVNAWCKIWLPVR